MKRDKKRVESEQWSDEQLQTYLNFNTFDGTDRDYHCLYRAYTRMNENTFEDFVELFKAEGRNIEATNNDGRTLKQIISGHARGQEYISILQ